MTLDLITTCAFGLEAVVVRELAALGYEARVARPGRIAFSGDENAVCRANLWLRSADRVLVQLAEFPSADFDALFDTTKGLPWEEWIAADAAIPVRGRSTRSQLTSVPAIQRTVKKAIVERLLSARPVLSLPETGPPVPVEVSVVNDVATLDVDTSGAGLHKRGYRTLAAAAQLRETLAAAMVQLSVWKPERPLVDPFCGTGTIVIEAAMIGRKLAPGRNRTFAAELWGAKLQAAAWTAAREEAKELALPSLPQRIIGCDADAESLKLARYHASLAGVADDIHFQQHEFSELSSGRQYGCVVTNPPYGVRMGSDEEIEELYRSMPRVLRRLKTWSHYILSARPDLEQLVGQSADKRRKLYNGRLECTLYQFFGPKPPRRKEGGPPQVAPAEVDAKVPPIPSPRRGGLGTGEEAGTHFDPLPSPPLKGEGAGALKKRPAFGGLREEAARQAAEFANRLKKMARHLRRWPTKRGITCYRIYERDIPEIPLVVDRYEDALHIAEFERPHDRTAAEHADWLDFMVDAAAKALETPRELVFVKHRQRQRGPAQYERIDNRHAERIVHEGGLKFNVNLSDYLDTGLFLDHRITRSMVRDAAAGKRFLNLFAYTGSFTVYAAAGGATETTTVDLSATYLEWAEENLRLNGLLGPAHRFIRDDSREYLGLLSGKPQFELAVVDPPTFSNSKRLDEDWDIQQNHGELLQQVLRVMTPGGVIFFSTNSRRFKLDEAALVGATVHEITKQTIPEDFRNKRIHRCWRIVKGEVEGLAATR